MLSSFSLARRAGPASPLRLLAVLLAACAFQAPWTLKAQKESAEEISTRDVEPTFKLQVERNLVLVRVVVRDAKGAALDNLRKEDFQLFDRGKPQTISHFSVEKPAPKPAEKPAEKKPPAELEAAEETEISPSAARRFLGLYVDDVHTTFENLVRARDAADHYLTASLQTGDRVGLFTASGQNQVDFTDDLAKLHQALFQGEMRFGITHQRIQYSGNDLVAFAFGNRNKQVVENTDQLLMLVIYGLDVDAILGRPFEEYFVI